MTLQFPRMPEQITKAESRILDYISNNPEEFLLSSIGGSGEKSLMFRVRRFPALCAVWAVGIIRSSGGWWRIRTFRKARLSN